VHDCGLDGGVLVNFVNAHLLVEAMMRTGMAVMMADHFRICVQHAGLGLHLVIADVTGLVIGAGVVLAIPAAIAGAASMETTINAVEIFFNMVVSCRSRSRS
jgi:hypothetical protein